VAEHPVDQNRSVSALEWLNVGLRGLMELGSELSATIKSDPTAGGPV